MERRISGGWKWLWKGKAPDVQGLQAMELGIRTADLLGAIRGGGLGDPSQ
jgi:hypothetical protein